MIEISIFRDKEGFPWQLLIEGHANYKKKGKDIVCSAISVLGVTAANALEDIAKFKKEQILKNKDGYIFITIPVDINDKQKYDVKIIMETVIRGLKDTASSYIKYVKIFEEEV